MSLEQSGVAFDIRLEQPINSATIADSLVKMADAINADLIVLGSRGRPAPVASVFGSVSREVARAAHVPVLIVRDAARKAGLPARLLLVVTQETLGSTEPDAALELAHGLGAKVTILHVRGLLEDAVEDLLRVPATSRPDHIANLLLAKFGAAGIEANLVIADNHDGLASEITRAAHDAGCDLIVIPAGTSDAAERWVLGTVDEEVGRRSQSPVLVAPPTDSARTVPGER
jgi:nucleotide-binding universal stress UspA family protein